MNGVPVDEREGGLAAQSSREGHRRFQPPNPPPMITI